MHYRLIGAASGWGAQIRACELGPEVLKRAKVVEKLREEKISVSELQLLYPRQRAKDVDVSLSNAIPLIHEINLQLAKEVERTFASGQFPIVLGGDHSIAIGTWNGVYQFFKKRNELPLGLIWIDAHMDAHTPETSPSGAWHGMPLAGLLGYGIPQFAKFLQEDPIVHPENLCLIGIRSFEKGEEALLKRLNVRVYFSEEVKHRGIKEVLREAIAQITQKVPLFGVSLDLDVLTSEDAPGVGTPETGGIFAKDLLNALALLRMNQAFKAFELVEYNPQKNHEQRTAKLCMRILSQIMVHDENVVS